MTDKYFVNRLVTSQIFGSTQSRRKIFFLFCLLRVLMSILKLFFCPKLMNQFTSLSIVLLLATISLVHGKWLLKTTASNCSVVPWSIYAENGNCGRISKDKYQKITCDGNTAITYECSTSGCTSCKQVQTTELNTCDSFGMTVQCFDQEPPYPKYVSPKFVTDNIYSEYNCAGDRLAVYAYSLDTCVNILWPSFVLFELQE